MKTIQLTKLSLALLACGAAYTCWAVSAEEATQLKTRLTPFGAERAGNADGSIPAWTGVPVLLPPYKDGRRTDPFADEKPLLQITAANHAQYADKLAESQVAMFRKYPDYRIDVYRSHRTAWGSPWIYENIQKNAVSAKLGKGGLSLSGAYGGTPFPIPKSGAEVMWNHMLRWQGESYQAQFNTWFVSSGKPILASQVQADYEMPYYFKDGKPWGAQPGFYWMSKQRSLAPAIRAGEGLVGKEPIDYASGGAQVWVYLTGQRRVRKVPVACCDAPTPASAGVLRFDDTYVFNGTLERYNWKLAGKKELYIPYNSNRSLLPAKDADMMKANFLNPDHVRWELHRVWVVEAALATGARHVSPKRRFYCDEDTWNCVLGDAWDARGQLVNAAWMLTYVTPEVGVIRGAFGGYDLVSGNYAAGTLMNEQPYQYRITPRRSDTHFTSESVAAEGVR